MDKNGHVILSQPVRVWISGNEGYMHESVQEPGKERLFLC